MPAEARALRDPTVQMIEEDERLEPLAEVARTDDPRDEAVLLSAVPRFDASRHPLIVARDPVSAAPGREK
jgi:hypothetical protein